MIYSEFKNLIEVQGERVTESLDPLSKVKWGDVSSEYWGYIFMDYPELQRLGDDQELSLEVFEGVIRQSTTYFIDALSPHIDSDVLYNKINLIDEMFSSIKV